MRWDTGHCSIPVRNVIGITTPAMVGAPIVRFMARICCIMDVLWGFVRLGRLPKAIKSTTLNPKP